MRTRAGDSGVDSGVCVARLATIASIGRTAPCMLVIRNGVGLEGAIAWPPEKRPREPGQAASRVAKMIMPSNRECR
jgi:hypothetical protein